MSILAFSQSQAREEKEKEKEEQDRVRQEHIQEQQRQCWRIKKMLQDANEVQSSRAFEKWVIGLPFNSETVCKLQMISNKKTLETTMNGNYPILSYPILSYPILSYPILSYPILSYPIILYFL